MAALAALSVTTPALLALSVSPASAGTGGGALLCKTTTLAPPPQDAPFVVHVTANPTGPKAPNGASIPVNGATVALTLPSAVTGNLKAQAGAGTIGLNQGIVKLDATHASGALQVTNLSAPAQTINNYNAVGGPGGTPTADPITFTITGVNFGTLTTNGANGQSVDISLAGNSSGDGFIFALGGGALIPTLGFGSLNSGLGGPGGGGICANDTAGANGTSWAPAVASVQLAQQSFTNTAKPKVAGTAKVGKTLTCKPGTWSPSPTTTAFKWLRDGKAIKKATKSKYKIVKADAKHKLSCSVTVSGPGYTAATATSGKTKKVPTP